MIQWCPQNLSSTLLTEASVHQMPALRLSLTQSTASKAKHKHNHRFVKIYEAFRKKNASRAENTSKYRNAAMKHLDIKGSGANVNDNQLIVGFYKELR